MTSGRDRHPSREPRAEALLSGDDWLSRVASACTPISLGTLGRYAIVREVARGGQGVVFEARDTSTGHPVALKLLLGGRWASTQTRVRLERELRVLRRLKHPRIVKPRALESIDDQLVLVMEWIDGVPIREWARPAGAEPRSRDEIVAILTKITEALSHAHQRGVIHRDLKPQNLLVDTDGEPRVLDFGLAKLFASDDGGVSSLTSTGGLVGTALYSAPEQLAGGDDTVDLRTDLYALGVIAVELLTGHLPYPRHDSLPRLLHAIVYEPCVSPAERDPSIDRDLDAIVTKLLAKSREDRYASADALLDDLDRRVRGAPLRARRETRGERMRRIMSQHRLALATALAGCVLLVSFALVMTVLYRRAEAEAARAVDVQRFLESTLVPSASWSRSRETTLVDMLDQAADRAGRELTRHPEAEASLRYTIASAYEGLWMWPETAENAERAYTLHKELLGERAPETLRAMRLLGIARSFLGDPAGLTLQQRGLELATEVHGAHAPETLASRGALAYALWKSADPPRLDEAREEYATVIATCERPENGVSTSAKAAHFHSYAAFLISTGDRSRALEYFAKAVALYATLPAAESIYSVQCLHDYGRELILAGRSDEGERAIGRALALTPETPHDHRVSEAHWWLGVSHAARGDHAGAVRSFERSLRLYAARLGVTRSDGVVDAAFLRETWRAAARVATEDLDQLLDAYRELAAALRQAGEEPRSAAIATICTELSTARREMLP